MKDSKVKKKKENKPIFDLLKDFSGRNTYDNKKKKRAFRLACISYLYFHINIKSSIR